MTYPLRYLCRKALVAPVIDGDPAGDFWDCASWSTSFLDIEGPDHHPQPWLRTRMKMLWDDTCLYIGAELEEPHLWATLTERDSVIFQDNDFEVFIDPDGDSLNYVELEINALNTVWDLLLRKPYRQGGEAESSFTLKGLQTAVKLDGKLNDPQDSDKGWALTIAIPWLAFAHLGNASLPPVVGDVWRINFSRVQWDLEVADGHYRKIPERPEHNWVWSPQWQIDMHQPEHWGYLEFANPSPNKSSYPLLRNGLGSCGP